MNLEFVETEVFTRRIGRLDLENDLQELQNGLLENPEAGRLDPGTAGLRKVRMSSAGRGKGKRGGARVHYLYLAHIARVYLVFIYVKGESDALTPDQKRHLTAIVKAIKAEFNESR